MARAQSRRDQHRYRPVERLAGGRTDSHLAGRHRRRGLFIDCDQKWAHLYPRRSRRSGAHPGIRRERRPRALGRPAGAGRAAVGHADRQRTEADRQERRRQSRRAGGAAASAGTGTRTTGRPSAATPRRWRPTPGGGPRSCSSSSTKTTTASFRSPRPAICSVTPSSGSTAPIRRPTRPITPHWPPPGRMPISNSSTPTAMVSSRNRKSRARPSIGTSAASTPATPPPTKATTS